MTDVVNYEPVLEMVIGMFVIMFDMLIAGLSVRNTNMNVETPFFYFILFLALRRISNWGFIGQVIQCMSTNDCTLDTLLALLSYSTRGDDKRLANISQCGFFSFTLATTVMTAAYSKHGL